MKTLLKRIVFTAVIAAACLKLLHVFLQSDLEERFVSEFGILVAFQGELPPMGILPATKFWDSPDVVLTTLWSIGTDASLPEEVSDCGVIALERIVLNYISYQKGGFYTADDWNEAILLLLKTKGEEAAMGNVTGRFLRLLNALQKDLENRAT